MKNTDEFSFLQFISDFLSIITISTCFILKIPQILRIIKVKNAQGISLVGLLLELSSYTITMSYNFRNHYALLTYMEYPIILIQEFILIACVLYYKRLFNIYSFIATGLYFLIAASFLMEIVPMGVLVFFVPLCTPIGASSKVVQLVEIIRNKNSDSVSALTWFISAFTNFTRIFTIFLDSSDPALLLNFTINTLLSSSILASVIIFKKPSYKKTAKND